MNKLLEKKKELLIGAIFVIAIIVCIVFFVVNKDDNEVVKEEQGKTDVVDDVKVDEKEIVDAYGMTSNQAIDIVKAIFNSDNFEFTCEVNGEAKYVVKAKNVITEKVYEYLVDPISGSFYEITK